MLDETVQARLPVVAQVVVDQLEVARADRDEGDTIPADLCMQDADCLLYTSPSPRD